MPVFLAQFQCHCIAINKYSLDRKRERRWAIINPLRSCVGPLPIRKEYPFWLGTRHLTCSSMFSVGSASFQKFQLISALCNVSRQGLDFYFLFFRPALRNFRAIYGVKCRQDGNVFCTCVSWVQFKASSVNQKMILVPWMKIFCLQMISKRPRMRAL